MKKKVGETFAFYLYDQWWARKEEKYKAEQRRKLESKKSEKVEKTSIEAADAPVHITAESSANAAPAEVPEKPDKRTEAPGEEAAAAAGQSAAVAATASTSALDVTSFFNQQREKMDAGGGSSSMIARDSIQ